MHPEKKAAKLAKRFGRAGGAALDHPLHAARPPTIATRSSARRPTIAAR